MKERIILQKMLDDLGLKKFYRIDMRIVRGLAYYTGFVFEAFQTVGAARALAGGGRYDNLVKKLGGADLPAVGFAIGDVTVTDLLRELGRLPDSAEALSLDVYVVIGAGARERAAALAAVAKLRAADASVDYPLKESGFGKQFKAADQSGARLALIFGPDEVNAGQVKLRDMRTGVEELLGDDPQLLERVRAALKNS
jgi:histidyl-tRNA synthetase